MIIIKKKVLSFILALTFLFPVLFIFHYSFEPVSVSADTSYTFVFPEEPVIYGLPSGLTAENVAYEIYENPYVKNYGYSPDNSYFFVNYNSSNNQYEIFLVFEYDINFDVIGKSYFSGSTHQYPLAVFNKGITLLTVGFSELSKGSFSPFESVQSGNDTTYGICMPSYVSSGYQDYLISSFYFDNNFGYYNSLNLSYKRGYCFGTYAPPPYNPVIMPIYEGVYSLSIQKDEFIKWLIDNERYVDIADGLVENRVSGFIDIFQRYGANNKAFGFNAKNFFDFIGIGQTVSDYGSVLEKTRSLYREYQQYVRFQLMEHYNNKVKDTLNIKPVTNDNNTSLITDSADDTVVVRLLRDILRSLIALPSNIGNLIKALELRVDGLDNTVNITNDSGLPDFSSLWTYSNNDFDDDLNNFSLEIANVQQLPVQYLTNINESPLMPEKMLNDKDNLTVNIPNISGFTVSDDGKSFSTQTTSYVISSNDYPWLDPLVKKIKRFSGILLILGYLVSLRYRLPEIVRGE